MRKAFVSFILEAEKMKRLLIALSLCLLFSSSAEAGKVVLSSKALDPDGLAMAAPGDDGSGQIVCKYELKKSTTAYVEPRKGTTIYLKVIFDKTTITLYSRYLPTTKPLHTAEQSPSFEIVGAGTEWILAWTLESDKGKNGHVIDAVVVASGTCN